MHSLPRRVAMNQMHSQSSTVLCRLVLLPKESFLSRGKLRGMLSMGEGYREPVASEPLSGVAHALVPAGLLPLLHSGLSLRTDWGQRAVHVSVYGTCSL